jgi:hypothetical protein
VRKRQPITLAAGGRWPDAGGGFGVRFNWVKIDNKGSNVVGFALSPMPVAGDKIDELGEVAAGKCRVFNVAGPKEQGDEDWPDAIYLVSASGTNLVLEVSDCPIVDMTYST